MACRTPKNIPFIYNKAIPFFSFRVKWRFLILGQSVGLKKKKLKKITRSRGIGGPGIPGWRYKLTIHIFGLTKCTIYCKKCTCFFSMLLLCSFFGLKELFPVKNGLDEANASVNSSCAHTPPLATAGHLLPLSVPRVGHLQILYCSGPGICQPRGH